MDEVTPEQVAKYRVKACALYNEGEAVGYTVFIVDEDDRIQAWAIREDEGRNRLNHAGYEWPGTPEAAVARYEAAEDLGNPATVARPYAPLIKSVRLPTD